MRYKAFVSVMALAAASAGASLAVAEDVPVSAPRPALNVVYLNGVADLEKLKKANPEHYARVEQVIATADQLCKPGPDSVLFAKEIGGASCQSMFVMTSNPPKHQLGVTIGDTRYVLLVTLKDAEPHFRRVPAVLPPQPVNPAK